MTVANWISGSIGLAVAGLILYLVRRDHLHTRYAIWWITAAVVMALLGIFPSLVDWIGNRLGVHYPPVIPLILGLIILVIKMLLLDIEHSRTEIKLSRLIQRLALLEHKLTRETSREE